MRMKGIVVRKGLHSEENPRKGQKWPCAVIREVFPASGRGLEARVEAEREWAIESSRFRKEGKPEHVMEVELQEDLFERGAKAEGPARKKKLVPSGTWRKQKDRGQRRRGRPRCSRAGQGSRTVGCQEITLGRRQEFQDPVNAGLSGAACRWVGEKERGEGKD